MSLYWCMAMACYAIALWRMPHTGHGDQVELDGVHLLQGIHHDLEVMVDSWI